MHTQYLFQGLTIDEDTQDYIEQRLAKLEKILSDLARFEIEVDAEKKGFYRVEVMVIEPRHQWRAEETQESIEACIDLVVDELHSQIIREEEKYADTKIRGERSLKKKLTIDPIARL